MWWYLWRDAMWSRQQMAIKLKISLYFSSIATVGRDVM